MSPTYRRVIKWARTTHLYLTLSGLLLILFFAVTGFMLNHVEWFTPEQPHTREVKGTLPTDIIAPADKFTIVEALRKDYGILGAVTAFDPDDEFIRVTFKRPGEQVSVEIKREDGTTTVTHEYRGWAAATTDLHRGNRGNLKDEVKVTGRAWSLLIDITCFLMLLISTTGLVMWWSLKGRGRWGLLVILFGGAAAFAVYYWWVP